MSLHERTDMGNQLRAASLLLAATALLLIAMIGALSDYCFAQTCSDPLPSASNCSSVRTLGEMDGCACFVCFAANGDRQQTVCTRNPDIKGQLLKKPRK